jgi:hypothetical protein
VTVPRGLPLLFLAAAVALAGWGGAAYLRQRGDPGPPAGPALSAERPKRDLGALPAGETYDVDFVVRNAGGRPCRVVGAPFL